MGEILKFLMFFLMSLLGLAGDQAGLSIKDDTSFAAEKAIPDISLSEGLVNRFYFINQQRLFWFSLDKESILRRKNLKNSLDSARYLGLDNRKYHYQAITEHFNDLFLPADSTRAMQMDRIFTDAALMFGKDIYLGEEIASWMNADEISPKFQNQDESYIVNQLIHTPAENTMTSFVQSLEPADSIYQLLKISLRKSIDSTNLSGELKLSTSMSQFRYVYHFKLDKFIVVNIPAASLSYFEDDSMKLTMKVVLGKPSTRTPRFAAYCDKVILFPYWNVPHNIAVNEYLPIFKKSPAMVTIMNMQILDSRGKIIPEDSIKWSLYSKSYFPYRVRQSTGCDNALGVIKFNLTSPFDVYLHDTNVKPAFKSDYRFYSHGCIRLEKPFELANYILTVPIDTGVVNFNLKEQNPKTITLAKPVPVFVVYMTAEVIKGDVRFFPDVYKLIK